LFRRRVDGQRGGLMECTVKLREKAGSLDLAGG
jgi:hypothetical protein